MTEKICEKYNTTIYSSLPKERVSSILNHPKTDKKVAEMIDSVGGSVEKIEIDDDKIKATLKGITVEVSLDDLFGKKKK